MKTNKHIRYLIFRNASYFLSFLNLLLISNILSEDLFSSWSFIIIIITYLNSLNFGTPYSINFYVIKYKNVKINEYLSNGFFFYFITSIIVFTIALVFVEFGGGLYERYISTDQLFIILSISLLFQLNTLLANISRGTNKLDPVWAFQIIQPLMYFFILMITQNNANLINNLLYSNIVGQVISLLIFSIYLRNDMALRAQLVSLRIIKKIIRKSLFLFIYNISFSYIILSSRLIISANYSVEIFARFSFWLMIGTAFGLFLEAVAFVVFPKLIDLMNSKEPQSKQFFNRLKEAYINLNSLFLFTPILFLPIIKHLPINYSEYAQMFVAISLALYFQSNLFGFNAWFIGNEKEKKLALINAVILFSHVFCSIILTSFFSISAINLFNLSSLSYIILYVVYYWQVSLYTQKDEIKINPLPKAKNITVLIIFAGSALNSSWISVIGVLIYFSLSIPNFIDLKNTIIELKDNPNSINI